MRRRGGVRRASRRNLHADIDSPRLYFTCVANFLLKIFYFVPICFTTSAYDGFRRVPSILCGMEFVIRPSLRVSVRRQYLDNKSM